jgi:hypothetical protein
MLYLIGGASRAGKSLLARRLLAEHGVPGFPLDAIMMAAQRLPEHGFAVQSGDSAYQRATMLWPFTSELIFTAAAQMQDYAFEGDYLLPRLVAVFQKKYPALPTRAVFLGYAQADPALKLEAIREHVSTNDWTRRLDANALQDVVQRQIDFSRRLRAECSLWGLPYVEAPACNHAAAMDRALATLVQQWG